MFSHLIFSNQGGCRGRVPSYTTRYPTQSRKDLVGLGRLELPTSPLSGVRSNQLSYKPILCFCSHKNTIVTCYPSTSFCSSYQNKTICVNTQRSKVRRNSKEVIQPQVPLGLPCYDFTPVMNHKVVTVLPKVRLATSFATHSHGVTGGVYKARERIHRDMLIRDY